jgi:hypothetical protein
MPHLRARLSGLISRMKHSLIQPIPPELDACEVCGKLRCPDDEWKSCERRIATAEFIRTGDRAALDRLEEVYKKASRKR